MKNILVAIGILCAFTPSMLSMDRITYEGLQNDILYNLTIGKMYISDSARLSYDCNQQSFEEAQLPVTFYDQCIKAIQAINEKALRLPEISRKKVMNEFYDLVYRTDSAFHTDNFVTFRRTSSDKDLTIFIDGVGKISRDELNLFQGKPIDWEFISSNSFGGGGKIIVWEGSNGATPIEDRPGRYSLIVVNGSIQDDICLSDLFYPDVIDKVECISLIKVSDAIRQYGDKGKKGVAIVSVKEGFESALLEWQLRSDMSNLISYWLIKNSLLDSAD